MKRPALLALLCLALAGTAAHAQSPFWKDRTGKPVPETASMKSRDGFAGSLVATTDEDWEAKWATPPENAPNFNLAGVVPYGKKVSVLVFFANPLKDAAGNVSVTCDIKVTQPDRKVAVDQHGLKCFAGPLAGGPYNLHLSHAVVAISADPGDPPGIVTIDVNLKDDNRRVALPLRTTFEVK